MQFRKKIIGGIFLSLFGLYAHTQHLYQPGRKSGSKRMQILTINMDSGLMMIRFYTGVCKNGWVTGETFCLVRTKLLDSVAVLSPSTAPRLLTVHGNVSYDFIYKSGPDQEQWVQPRFQQHTERINLELV